MQDIRKTTVEESRAIYTSWIKRYFKSPKELIELEGKKTMLHYNQWIDGIYKTNIFIFEYTDTGTKVEYVVKKGGEYLDYKVHDVEIEFEQCTYGNYRFYFKCPLCSKRRTSLYYKDDDLGCRECLKLNYRSSQRSRNKLEEIRYKMIQIHKKLDTKHSIDNLHPKRPKGMHYETYYRLIGELQHLERCFNTMMSEIYFRHGTYKDVTTNEFIELMR